MKRTIIGIALVSASSGAMAGAAGGDQGCGWGNALFEGSSGTASHVLAAITNTTFGNNTFGMTTGTNGCDTSGTLGYGGKSAVSAIMDEFSEDVARGQGDALSTVAVLYNVQPSDRQTFARVMHENFAAIFPNEDVTTDEVIASVEAIMKSDPVLSKYITS